MPQRASSYTVSAFQCYQQHSILLYSFVFSQVIRQVLIEESTYRTSSCFLPVTLTALCFPLTLTDSPFKDTHSFARPSPTDILRYRYHHGPNLGGIFVFEQWLHGSMFDANSAGSSELDAVTA